MTKIEFKNRKLNIKKLLSFGFIEQEDSFVYTCDIADGCMTLTVIVSSAGTIHTKIIDKDSGDEYILHLVSDAQGQFVGKVKTEYETVLEEISQKCFDSDVFKNEQTKRMIEFVRSTYGDELEFLWKKFTDNAVWRRKDSKKWYGAVLTVCKNKLGINSDEVVEIIDLRIKPEHMEEILSNENYYPGWHMNKKHWFTVILDDSVADEELFNHIKTSYEIANK